MLPGLPGLLGSATLHQQSGPDKRARAHDPFTCMVYAAFKSDVQSAQRLAAMILWANIHSRCIQHYCGLDRFDVGNVANYTTSEQSQADISCANALDEAANEGSYARPKV